MRRQDITVSSLTNSPAIPLNIHADNFQVGLGCIVSPGAVLTYKVQHTFDDVFDSTVTPNWFDHSAITGKTASIDGNYAFPVTAIRLVVTAYTSGSVSMAVLQSGR